MNDSAETPLPIDLRDLQIVRSVAARGSLTRAAAEVGLTQSALTRQVQSIETRLGMVLFDRTTRRLEPTAAARALLDETASLSTQFAASLRRLRASFSEAPREIRIGLSRSVALAHLPGLLHAHRRRAPNIRPCVAHLDDASLMTAAQDGLIDLAILDTPRPLPAPLHISHRMTDAFALIGPSASTPPAPGADPHQWTAPLRAWLNRQSWLHFTTHSSTGEAIQRWLRARELRPAITAELDSFDMIVHLCALGLGIALVPRRALAGFPRRNLLCRIPLPETFSRELVVVTRESPSATPPHVRLFVESILFS